MIRVGFVLEFDDGWQGGTNYFRNLLQAINALPEREIEPIVFLGKKSGTKKISALPPCTVVQHSMFDRRSMAWAARKLAAKLFGRDVLVERLLKKNGIQILSHSGSLGNGSRMPCLCWMADFQHRRMPEFFSQREISLRDATIEGWGKACHVIILSSHDALNDLQRYYPDCLAKLEVLQFVSAVAECTQPDARAGTEAGTATPEKYFLVANQFWAHKNHRVLLEALKHLEAAGQEVKIIATGNTHDYRQPGHYAKLMAEAQAMGVSANFTATGMVSMDRLASLMDGAVAIINPSLFEGWNTAVEEAKSLGKQVILSDIPVHREQSPERAHYFEPHDAAGLAEIMWKCWCDFDRNREQIERQKAATAFAMRRQAFGAAYQRIVLEAYSRAGGVQ